MAINLSILNKVLNNDLQVTYSRASQQEIIKPYEFQNYHEDKTILLRVDKGDFCYGANMEPLKVGHSYFIPPNEPIFLRCSNAKSYTIFGESGFPNYNESARFHKKIAPYQDISDCSEVLSLLFFDANIYNAFGLFSFMNFPAIALPPDEDLDFLIKNIVLEEALDKIGRDSLIKNYIFEIVIHICRYISTQSKFERHIEKLSLSADKRLLDVLIYIKEHLGDDLNNTVLAEQACVAEQYVGQYFKGLTGKNLQNYIQNQRLERAYELLLTNAYSVQEVGNIVGFNDNTYFSRSFKARFGMNAIDVKRKIKQDSNFIV
jgi:AraC-like DNA-binding protein